MSESSKNNNEESKTNSVESNFNKRGNTSNNLDKNNNNISYNDREINAKHLSNNQQIFFNLQKYLETNIQPFFHKLSLLKNLKTLNLSHNKKIFPRIILF